MADDDRRTEQGARAGLGLLRGALADDDKGAKVGSEDERDGFRLGRWVRGIIDRKPKGAPLEAYLKDKTLKPGVTLIDDEDDPATD